MRYLYHGPLVNQVVELLLHGQPEPALAKLREGLQEAIRRGLPAEKARWPKPGSLELLYDEWCGMHRVIYEPEPGA